MTLRSTFLRARWLLLLLPLFALGSTMQVGCVGGADRQDDYAREDPKNQNAPGTAGSPSYGGRPGGQYGGGQYDDDFYGYGDE